MIKKYKERKPTIKRTLWYYHKDDCGVHEVQDHCDIEKTLEIHIIYPWKLNHTERKVIQELVMVTTEL